MRPLLQFIRRWKRKIKRAHRRYGNHPFRAIYLERLRRHFFFLGMRWARRKEPKSPIKSPAPPPVPYVPIPQTLQWPTVEWSRSYYDIHPELYTSKTPLRSRKTVRLEPLEDENWLTRQQDTDPFALERDTDPTTKIPLVKMQEKHKQKEREWNEN